MQTDNPDYHRHQLVEALGQCGQQLRHAAALIDSYAAFVQNLPHTAIPLPMQNMFQMFTPPQSGAQPTIAPPPAQVTNGIHPPAPAPVAVPAAPARGRKRRDAEPEGDGTVKRRRRRAPGEKKERDPNAPKRPPSAYLIFQNEIREEMKKIYPGRPYIEVLNKISDRWSEMSGAEKKPYIDATSELRAKFGVDKAAYETSLAVQAGTSLAGSATTAAPEVVPPAPSVPAAPPVPAQVPATAASNQESDDEEEEEEASLGSSSNDEDDSSSSEEAAKHSVKAPPRTYGKQSPRKESIALPKPTPKAKAEKEDKKKSKRSRKEN